MRIYPLFLLLLTAFSLSAQPTLGLLKFDAQNNDGYVLFSPMQSHKTFLIDKCGRKINEWTSQYNPGLSCYLVDNGNILRTGVDSANNTFGVNGGIIEKRDWNNNLLWQYIISNTMECQHHDILQLPNGNILAIVWEKKAKTEAIAQGRRPNLTSNNVWSEKIVELQPSGPNGANIVWEWHLWDHMNQDFDSTKPNYTDVSQHPELIDINKYGGLYKPDWIHLNSIDYNPQTDQILLSSHSFNEIWIIDHSTTTAQAATHTGGNSGKGGDFLYRWGNPFAYSRGILADMKFFGQHNAQWIKPGFPNAGKIIVFNNGNGRTPTQYSSIDIINPPIGADFQYPIDSLEPFLPDTLTWTYAAPVPADFFSPLISGVEPLQDGSFVICEGASGRFFEINQNKETVWEYINPYSKIGPLPQFGTPTMNNVFRASFLPPDHPSLFGLTLTPGAPLEINPISPSLCDSIMLNTAENPVAGKLIIYPNPTTGTVQISLPEEPKEYSISIFNIYGQLMFTETTAENIDIGNLPKGVYFINIRYSQTSLVSRIVLQ